MKSIKVLLVILLPILFLVSSCKDDDTPTADNDYFFKITYDGTEYFYDSDVFQSGHIRSTDHLGGWSGDIDNPFGGDGVKLIFDFPDSAYKYNILTTLPGKRFYFDGSTATDPGVEMIHALGPDIYYSDWGIGQSYYVEVTDARFLRNEPSFNYDIYAVTGTFRTSIETPSGNFSDATGSFNMQVSLGKFQ